jgi:exo-1,4-beta-D-glucosaminidase
MSRIVILIYSLSLAPAIAQTRHLPIQSSSRIDFEKQWTIQSSAKVTQGGAEISTQRFDIRGWYPARVPSTVLAALVANDVYPDPYFGMNLRSLSGMTYDIGDNFSNVPMAPDSPYAVSWWYRNSIRIPHLNGQRVWLNFDSINYSANIWLNGRQVASADQVRGMYRTFEFDVTDFAVAGNNTLAVEVFTPTENDFTITFVDWNPMPPDRDMGLVGDVYIRTSGPVALRNPQVIAKVDPTLDTAHLTLFGDLNNAGSQTVDGTLRASIGAITVSTPVRLAAGASTRVSMSPTAYPQLNIQNPDLWWPNGLGPQNLQQLHIEYDIGENVSDADDVRFGIREFTSEIDAQLHRVFRINGRRILIRGGGWTQDMMLRVDDEREDNEFRYALDMRLNTIRLEGKLMNQHFFDTADRLGMMVMPGWCCCAYFEQWQRWIPDDYTVAGESLRSQLRRLRNHPSVFVFLYGSDESPPPAAEQVYLNVLQQENWPLPYISSATNRNTVGAGQTGVKMNGPYDYVPPNYWLEDTKWGGAWGFNTETSPGHAIPVLASLQEMLPPDHLWPVDDFWNFHAASPDYPDIKVYTAAMDARYGPARDLNDFLQKSHVMAYEGERAMFEAYGRNKYTATGVIQWMLKNAWPSIVWHLYDWYLRPGGGYFGTKKANEPLHVQYSYDDRSVVVVNSLYDVFPGYAVTAKVYNFDLTEMFSQTASVDIGQDSATRVFTLPAIAGLSRTYFMRLQLRDQVGALVSDNFYWLSTQDDVVDWNAQTNYRNTPIATYADLTDLQNLPQARVTVAWQSEESGTDRIEHVAVQNPSSQLAFFVHLTVLKGKGGGDIAPICWEDNYFELMPGESRVVAATYARKLLGGAQSYVQVDGWNVAPPIN